jgi:hypothetical protein
MDQRDLEPELRQSLGKVVRITFGGQTDTVLIRSVDADGFVCQVQGESGKELGAEFWVPYTEVTELTEL